MSATQDSTKSQQQLAEERTEIAYQRTFLAEERTFSAWVRTGLAAIATGFAIVKLMHDANPAWLIRVLSILFVTAGGAMFMIGFWTYRGALRRVRLPLTGVVPIWIIGSLSLVLLLCAATGAVFLLLE